jgi:3-deoxy-D-manno-octulosonic-acid transferase
MAGFALSDIVTMGGSFSDIGGHNPLEPALFKKPIIVGSDMSNFNEVSHQLLQKNAIIQLNKNNTEIQLSNAVTSVLSDPEQQAILGEQAHNVVLSNQGATKNTLVELNKLIEL